MKIHVIPWNERYIRAIDNVFLETWLETYPSNEFHITEDDVYSAFWIRKQRLEKRIKQLRNKTEDDIYLMAKIGNKIVGVLRWRKSLEFNELEALYILPQFQRKWIGKALWITLQSHFWTNNPIIVRVATYNQNAIQFYKNIGFMAHSWEFDTKKVHKLKNGKELPLTTMILTIKAE